MYQDKKGDWHMEQGDNLTIKNVKVEGLEVENNINDLYAKEGMAIFIKGNMVIGIHPNNLENNLEALQDGGLEIDWGYFLERIKDKTL